MAHTLKVLQMIPKPHIEKAYKLGKQVYAGNITSTEAVAEAISEPDALKSECSANFLICNFQSMRDGHGYKRTMSIAATECYLSNILRDFGPSAYRNALKAVAQHISYAKEHDKHLPGLEAMLAKHKAKNLRGE